MEKVALCVSENFYTSTISDDRPALFDAINGERDKLTYPAVSETSTDTCEYESEFNSMDQPSASFFMNEMLTDFRSQTILGLNVPAVVINRQDNSGAQSDIPELGISQKMEDSYLRPKVSHQSLQFAAMTANKQERHARQVQPIDILVNKTIDPVSATAAAKRVRSADNVSNTAVDAKPMQSANVLNNKIMQVPSTTSGNKPMQSIDVLGNRFEQHTVARILPPEAASASHSESVLSQNLGATFESKKNLKESSYLSEKSSSIADSRSQDLTDKSAGELRKAGDVVLNPAVSTREITVIKTEGDNAPLTRMPTFTNLNAETQRGQSLTYSFKQWQGEHSVNIALSGNGNSPVLSPSGVTVRERLESFASFMPERDTATFIVDDNESHHKHTHHDFAEDDEE